MLTSEVLTAGRHNTLGKVKILLNEIIIFHVFSHLPDIQVLMIGDDLVNDVGGAQHCGIRGVQVRTGKYRLVIFEIHEYLRMRRQLVEQLYLPSTCEEKQDICVAVRRLRHRRTVSVLEQV